MTDTANVLPAPGYYEGKIVAYGIKKTKNGDPAPTICFTVESEGSARRVYWQGSFKDGMAREIALKALIVCGLNSYNRLPYLADGVESGLLDMDKEVQLTIAHETGEDGSRYPRVQWINEAGGTKFKNAISSQEACTLMCGLGLEADFIRLAKEHGIKIETNVTKQANTVEIPF